MTASNSEDDQCRHQVEPLERIEGTIDGQHQHRLNHTEGQEERRETVVGEPAMEWRSAQFHSQGEQ
jgi:hypothetical protein